ncbi:MAG TPA: hypothetical protein ENF32_05455 [Thermosulfidibacter takaii]|uniref:DUF2148 domain-containing protein n=1 Tax=Thermosulfidibacter takaii TaxID=412593 RepID=A0A7C0Y9Q6_9BACT|nr:hypothetical protein [Thermosulfidibacter takaii]
MEEAVKLVAQLMMVAARTAPKGRGEDYVVMEFLTGKRLKKLGEAMVEYGEDVKDSFYVRDGKSVLASQGVLLVGLKDAKPVGLNCGGCGFERCIRPEDVKEFHDFRAPVCMIRVLDLGIALGSAVKTASIHNVDNRIMYRVGVLARKLEMIDADIVMGIPLSVSGKSPYFDR